MNNKIGNQIVLLRKEKSLKQYQLAKEAGLSTNALCNIENGKCIPKHQTLLSILKVLGVEYDDFMRGIFGKDDNSQKILNALSQLNSLMIKENE